MFGIGAGLLCWTLLLWRFSTEPAIGLWLLTMTFLFFRYSSAVYILIGVLIMWPLFARQLYAAQLAANVSDTSTVLFAIILVAFTWFAFGFVDALSAFSFFPKRKLDFESDHLIPLHGPTVGTGATGLLLIPVAVLLAVQALALFPENDESRLLYRLTPGGLRAITFIWVIGTSWIVVKTMFGLIGWFRMSQDEATMYVRNIFGHEIRRELGTIERIRARNKNGF